MSADPPAHRLTRAEAQRLTRARLLDAARRVFAEKGFDRASLDDVAGGAGLTKGAVYSNFPTKGDLIRALMEQRRGEQRHTLGARAAGDPALPLEERSRRAGAAYAAAMADEDTRDWAVLVLEYWTHAVRGEPARSVLVQALRDLRQAVQEDLRARPEAPSSEASADLAGLAAVVVALDVGLALQHLLDPEEVPAELYGTALARLLRD